MSLDVGWGPGGQSGGENPFDFVLPDKDETTTSWRWATVVSSSPLRVTLDGDDSPLLATPWDMGSPAPRIPGDRVYCQINARRVVILGPNGGGGGGGEFIIDSGKTATRAYLSLRSRGADGSRLNGQIFAETNGKDLVVVPRHTPPGGSETAPFFRFGGADSQLALPAAPTTAGSATRKDYVDAIHRASILGANVNLNDLIEPGAYIQNLSGNASTALNYPTNVAGLCEVYGDGTSTQMRWQRYSAYGTMTGSTSIRQIYQRAFYSNAWSDWSVIYDPTDVASSTGPTLSSVASGWTINAYARRRNGICLLKLEPTAWPAVSAGGANITLCTVQDGFRPGIEAPFMVSDFGWFGRIGSNGVIVIQYRVEAISANTGNPPNGWATFPLA